MVADDRRITADSWDASGDGCVRLASLPQRPAIWERILCEAIQDPQVRPHRRRAQFAFFCGADPDECAGDEAQLEAVGRCLEWFVFDYVIAELDTTPAEHWRRRHGDSLAPAEKAQAGNFLSFMLGMFEIDQVDAEQGFVAIDLLRPRQSYEVSETVLTREVQPGQLLLGRLFPQNDEHYLLSGMAALMDAQATAQIKQFMAEGRLDPAEILQNLDGLTLENLFGRNLDDVEKLTTAQQRRRLRQYLEEVCPNRVSFAQLSRMIDNSANAVDVVAHLCERLQVHCRHEMDVLVAYVMPIWFAAH